MVLAVEGPHGRIIHDVSRAAAKLGMQAGARVTDMRVLVPDLRVEDAAPDCDAADLARLGQWVRRWAPWSQVDGTAGLLLDATGSTHLHGGEEALLRDMVRAFAKAGLSTRIAIAPTIGAAWALARYSGKPRVICAQAELSQRLAPLPAAALRLDGSTVLLLKRLGLKTVGALADLPREALVRRFRRIEAVSANPVLRLDQAMGRQPELLVSEELQPPPRSLRRLAEPLGDKAGLEQVLGDLAADLCAIMEDRQCGARGLRFTAFRVDGEAHQAEARTSSASREAAHLISLFDGRLDRFDPGFGFEAATLEAIDVESLAAVQDDLAGEQAGEDIAFARLVDRLVSRLGYAAVLQARRQGSHLPEYSEQLMPAANQPRAAAHMVTREAATPLRLLDHPEEAEVIHAVPDGPPARFRWRHQLHTIARSQGPERIAPEWWRARPNTRLRDYYHVEDSVGRRYWLYREGLADDGRGGNPRWFVHGLDA